MLGRLRLRRISLVKCMIWGLATRLSPEIVSVQRTLHFLPKLRLSLVSDLLNSSQPISSTAKSLACEHSVEMNKVGLRIAQNGWIDSGYVSLAGMVDRAPVH